MNTLTIQDSLMPLLLLQNNLKITERNDIANI